MERKQFLRTLGTGAAFALTFPCLHSCSSDSDEVIDSIPVPTGVDFTIDLSSTEGAKLQNNGDFIIKNYVVVVKNLEGDFVAASQICSHQQTDGISFKTDNGGYYKCSEHGSTFSQDGTPLNNIGDDVAKPLKIFNTELEGQILRVFE